MCQTQTKLIDITVHVDDAIVERWRAHVKPTTNACKTDDIDQSRSSSVLQSELEVRAAAQHCCALRARYRPPRLDQSTRAMHVAVIARLARTRKDEFAVQGHFNTNESAPCGRRCGQMRHGSRTGAGIGRLRHVGCVVVLVRGRETVTERKPACRMF